jgi:hypothetical protein
MGFFKKVRGLAGAPPRELLEDGLLGRGIITDVQATNVSTGVERDPSHVCIFTVEVSLDETPRYTATCRQAIKAILLPQLMTGRATVAVRVNPEDHSQIALDLATAPPIVTVSADSGDPSTGSATDVLDHGLPCRAVIVQSLPLGKRNTTGVELYGFLLTIVADGQAPYQTRVGMPVPSEAVPLLYPGNNVAAKRVAGRPDQVVIDWPAALAEADATDIVARR